MSESPPDYQLIYPYDLPVNRGSLHWRVRYEQRKKAIRAFGKLMPHLRATTPAEVMMIRVQGPRQRDLDHGVFWTLTRGLVDGLVAAGYLVDDSPKWASFEHREDDTRRHLGPRIEVLISYEEV
jgi:hypothetical protein